jgi:hypothetical protein
VSADATADVVAALSIVGAFGILAALGAVYLRWCRKKSRRPSFFEFFGLQLAAQFLLAVLAGVVFLLVLGVNALHLTWLGVVIGVAAIGVIIAVAWLLAAAHPRKAR